jgi:hypothetical protein
MAAKRSVSAALRRSPVSIEPAPLTTLEQRGVAEALAEFTPLWSIELQGICVDDATLVILPESGDDMLGPSFVISRDTMAYRLDQVHWDRIWEVGQYSSLMDIVPVIRQRILLCLPMLLPLSATVH